MTNNVINIVIGNPLVPWYEVCCTLNPSEATIIFEEESTLFTKERIPAKILKDIGVVKSISEVRRNKPELCEPLTQPDCFWLKWVRRSFGLLLERRNDNVRNS